MGREYKDYKDRELKELVTNLGDNLKTLREQKDISQLELAAKAGLSISTISEIENGKAVNVRLRTITAIARQLKKDPLDLLKK